MLENNKEMKQRCEALVFILTPSVGANQTTMVKMKTGMMISPTVDFHRRRFSRKFFHSRMPRALAARGRRFPPAIRTKFFGTEKEEIRQTQNEREVTITTPFKFALPLSQESQRERLATLPAIKGKK